MISCLQKVTSVEPPVDICIRLEAFVFPGEVIP